MTVTGEETPAAPPKRSLAEMVAAIKLKEQQTQARAVENSTATVDITPAIRRRLKRAANGTRRFKNVMIKLEPEMIQDLDKIGAEMRLSRSELLRQAAQRVWLEEKGYKS